VETLNCIAFRYGRKLENTDFVIGLAFATYLVLTWGKAYWGKRLILWAKKRGFILVDWRGAAAWEGPGAFIRANQQVFRVKVRDRDGKIMQGWLCFGKNLNPFSAPDELLEERWD